MRPLASFRLLGPRVALLTTLATTLAACGGGGDPVEPPPPPAPTPSALVAAAGGTPQTATVGTAVAAVPSVRVTSSAGQPVPGVAVAFAVTAGGGTLGAASATTNADGVASAGSWTLGTTAGANAVRATVGSLTPVTFEATGQAGPAARVEAVGAGQSATVATAVPTAPGVKVVDAHGNAVSGVAVTFAVASGGGTVATTTATTGADGVASAGAWTLGTTPGANVLTATAGALAPVTLTANAQTGPAAQLRVVSGGDQRAVVGATLPAPLVVAVQDGQGNPVAGAPVRFQIWMGGGSLAATEATSDAEGRATSGAWTLGGLVGSQSVLATIAGHDGIAINALVDAGPPAKLELTGGGQTGTVATLLPVRPAATVRDAFDNPLSGVTVRFTPSAGTIGRSEWPTDGTGLVETLGWTLGTVAGAQTVDVAVVGTTLTGRLTATATAGAAASLAVVSGGGQDGWTEEALAQPIVVKATDAHGNAVPNVAIAFSAAAGNGTPSAAQATTGATGEAQVTWTLGDIEGAQAMSATVGATITVPIAATGAFPTLTAAAISVGWVARQCVVSAQGALSCWGSSDRGVIGILGDGTKEFRSVPVPVGAAYGPFTDVSVGSQHTCALTASGTAYCWGLNSGGSLGDGSFDPRSTPTPVAGGHTFVRIHAGGVATCALKADGTAWCWGNDAAASLERAKRVPTPVGDSLQFTDITAGVNALNASDDQKCGVTTTGRVYCWKMVGIGMPDDVTPPYDPYAPAPIDGAPPMTSLTQGNVHTCAITDDGTAYCWGQNAAGQLGTGSTSLEPSPTQVRGTPPFVAISAGRFHTCALTASGDAYCWGDNEFGQLGIGILGDGADPGGSMLAPRRVTAPPGVAFRQLSSGHTQTCAVATTSVVYCWGMRAAANGNAAVYLTPTRVRAR